MKSKLKKITVWGIVLSMLLSCRVPLSADAANENEINNEVVNVQDDQMRFNSENSLGKLLSEEIQGVYSDSLENTDEQYDANYSIQKIDMEYSYADVYFNVENDCKLVVGLYSEDEQVLYTSAYADVTNEMSVATVYFDMMPDDYFLIKAYLVDSNTLAPLSESFTNNCYTREIQEFYSLTPEDFSGKEVLLLDEQSAENFAVFDANTKVIPYHEETNTIVYQDDASGTYKIENIDASISNLSSGDIAAIYYGEQIPLLIKVNTISIEGNAAEITSAETSLDEIFEFFRLNSFSGEIEYDEEDLLEGVTASTEYSESNADTNIIVKGEDTSVNSEIKFELDNEGNKSASAKTTLTVDIAENKFKEINNKPEYVEVDPSYTAEASVKGKVSCSFGVCLKFNFNKNGTGKTYAEFNISTSVNPDISLTGNISLNIPLSYKSIKVPIKGGFYITFNPAVNIQANAGITLKTSLEFKTGVKYDETESDKLQIIRDYEKGEAGIEIKGSLYIGLNFHPEIKWVSGKILSFDIEQFGGGLLFKGTLFDGKIDFTREDILNDKKPAEYSTNLSDEKTVFHTCIECIDGEILFQAKIRAQLKLLDLVKKESEGKGPSISASIPDIHLAYYYISLIGENADLLKEANFGRCPHKVFLLNLKFKDKDTGEILKGIDYKITDQDGNSKSFNSADYPKIWRRAGNYTISASLEGYKDYTKDYSIEYRPEHKGSLLNIVYEDFDLYINDSQTNDVTIYMESIKHNVTVNVVSENGKPIDKPAIKCSYNTSGIINNIIKSATNAVNYFRITNPQQKAENSFEFSLPKGTHTFTVSKAGFETVNVPVNVDQNDEEITVVLQVKKINLSVAVIDADGLPIESPTIIIQGNQCEYTPKQSIDGEYTYELPIGTYMLSVSKEGYMSETGDEIAQQEITVGLIENDYVTVKLIPGLKDWQKAYADYLKEQYKTKSYLKFSTAYINDDDIPELITAESDMRVATASVYTFYDGEVKLCGSGGESGILTYKEKQNMFMSYYGIMGNLRWKLFSIVDGKVQQVISISESSNTGKYFVNDQEVSESEYEKYYNEYDLENQNNTWNVIKYSSNMVKPTDENIEKYIYEVVSGYSNNNSYSTNSEYLSSEVLQESSDAAYSDSESYLPDTLYNFYVLHDNSAGLNLSNIVYFNQYHTDVNGRMDIPYQLNGMTEGKDYFLIHYGYIPKNNSIIDETDTFGDDFECKMAVNDIIYFDTENNDLTITAYDPEIISVDKDGVCTALAAGTTKLTIVQNDIKTYNIEIMVENETSPGDINNDGNIDISDATMVLMMYAYAAAGMDMSKYTEEQLSTADIDSNGKVSISDATFILTYYAQNAAGMNPSWEDILKQ